MNTPPSTGAPLIAARGLRKEFPTDRGVITAVDDVSLEVYPGEVVGLVGESGSGKSTVGRLVLRLTDLTAGSVHVRGEDISDLDAAGLRPFRRSMQMIFQDPYASLNRRMSVRAILEEPLRIHGIPRAEWGERCHRLLETVGLPASALAGYPHAFSGGQRQRIGIARALAVDPAFVVADEPVSALDVSVQAQVLNLLSGLRQRLGLSMLFVAHDLAVVRHIADRVMVMYLGRIVEEGPAMELYGNPVHPYTQALISAAPVPIPGARRDRIVLTGDLPSPRDIPSGCGFRTRCPIARDICAQTTPTLEEVTPGHKSACLLQ